MDHPPFAVSPLAGALARGTVPAAAPAPAAAVRRARLADLNPHFHCSLIGTCIGTSALRRLVRRHVPAGGAADTDLEVHHDAVALAMDGGAGAKALGKALDEQHALVIRRYAVASDEAALGTLWAEALKSGEVPGAYWALMTHPLAGDALRQRAFGDVHMLSHLVGAANRADIRRLVALEARNAELQEQGERLQARLQEAAAAHEAQLAQARAELARARGEAARVSEAGADAGRLEAALERLALHDLRLAVAEREAQAARAAGEDAEGRLARQVALAQAQQEEIAALEVELAGAGASADGAAASPLELGLRGLRLLYVGGRPSTLATIRVLAEGAGARWLHHDGGLEDRKGLLAGMLPRVDCVVFPVDCIDHDSMQQLKRLCARHGLPYRPLRSASVASFVAAMGSAPEQPLVNGAAVHAHFCVRHG